MKFIGILTTLLLAYSASAQYPIGERTINYNDPDRNNRSIECEIYYPGVSAGNNVDVAAGSFPVVVLGHGFAMGVNVYNNWWEEFVPEGYIFVLPTTEGSLIPAPSHNDFGLDLRFMATTMQSENGNATSPFYLHVAGRTGVMGHSMGGGATILGASGFSGVDCIVGLAPAETNPSAVSAASGVTAPALILSGEDDSVTPPNDHHIPIYNALGSTCKDFVSIENGSHCYFAEYNFNCSFGEIIPGSLSREDQQELSYTVIRPFFNYFLKDSCEEFEVYQNALTNAANIEYVTADCPNDAPTIIDNSGTLESSSSGNYQWYLDGVAIPGAIGQTHTYSASGSYQVATINQGNCEVFSNSIVALMTSISKVDKPTIQILEKQVIVSGIKNKSIAEWFNSDGRIIEDEVLNGLSREFKLTIPDHSGILILRISDPESQIIQRVVGQ